MSKKWSFQALPKFFWLIFPIITFTITYLKNRSLFVDEASLALNVIQKSYIDLLQPLDYGQAAPIGFLLVSKVFITIFGSSEYTLRFFPFLLGVFSCLLLYKLCKHIVPTAIPFVLIWFASNNFILRYATEFKQYFGDFAFTLLLVLVAHYILETKRTRLMIVLWSFIATIAVWFSHPIVFVIFGVGLTMIFYLYRRKNWAELRILLVGCVVASISFFIAYFISYQHVAQGTELADFMQDFWGYSFFQWNWLWSMRFLFLLFRLIAELNNPLLLILVVFGFIIGLRRIQAYFILMFLLVVATTLVASNLNLYPLSMRFLLFLVPFILLICVSGLEDVYIKLRAANSILAISSAISVFGLLVWQVNLNQYFEETRQAFEYIYSVSEEDTVVFISPETERVAWYYDFPYQVLSNFTITEILDTSQTDAMPTWLIIIERHWKVFPLNQQQNLDPHFQLGSIYAFCFDGTQSVCPDK